MLPELPQRCTQTAYTQPQHAVMGRKANELSEFQVPAFADCMQNKPMNRRMTCQILGGAAAMLTGHAGGALASDADAQGFYMPDEADAHDRTWMGFASGSGIWGSDLAAVQQDLMRIADAIAVFEPVSMLVNANAVARAEKLLAQSAHRANIQLVAASLDDLWLRDTGPVFTRHRSKRELRAVNFNFNGWGGKQVHARDAKVAAFIAAQAGAPVVATNLVLEGGGVEVDGEGTAIIKESCVLNPNRNPRLTKREAEKLLSDTLGLAKIIWLPGPAGGDITDGHTDFYARFAGAGRVVVSHDAQDTYGEKTITQNHISALRQAADAKGRRLSLTLIDVPTEPASPKSFSDTFAAGYINYYLCNGGLILPAFGDAAADRAARNAMRALYPARQVVQIRIDAIAAGGGGIHCTTQQQPKA